MQNAVCGLICVIVAYRERSFAGNFRGPYVVDFVCPDARLIVELDGGQHASQLSADEVRTKFLQQQGYRVLRFWNNDVLKETEGVLEGIKGNLIASQSGPSP